MNNLKDFLNEQREVHGLTKLEESIVLNEEAYGTKMMKKAVAGLNLDKDEYKETKFGYEANDKEVAEKIKQVLDKEGFDVKMKGTSIIVESMEQVELHEGANSTNPSAVFSELIKILEDGIKGFAGKNGSNDPKHPEASKINKNLRDALKSVKAAKKELKSNDEIWLKSVKLNEGEELDFDLELSIGLDEAELSPLQKEYQDYFKDTLAEFDAESPAKLSAEKKLEFFNTIKSGWVKGEGRKK